MFCAKPAYQSKLPLACGILATDPKVSPTPKMKAWVDVSGKFPLWIKPPLQFFLSTAVIQTDLCTFQWHAFLKAPPCCRQFPPFIKSNQIKVYLFRLRRSKLPHGAFYPSASAALNLINSIYTLFFWWFVFLSFLFQRSAEVKQNKAAETVFFISTMHLIPEHGQLGCFKCYANKLGIRKLAGQ